MSKINLLNRISKNIDHIKNRVEEISEEYCAEEEWARQQKPLEEKLYAEFVKCNKGKDFIHLEDIDNLGVPYDVLIVTSIKNTGKTTNIIYNRFNYYYEQGKKVMFMRTSQKEIIETISEYNNTPKNPFFFKKKGGIIRAYHKESGEDCGCFKDFKFCNSGSGGEFLDYGAIIYDECFSWDPRNTLNKSHFMNWGAVTSSITRNKEDGIKIYCMGNITGSNDGLLDYYGIKRDDRLRYIRRASPDDPSNVCNILFINVNDIYKGIAKQVGSVQGMSPEFKKQLFSNEVAINAFNIINPSDFNELTPYPSFIKIFIKEGKKIPIFFEIRTFKPDRFSKEKSFYALRIREWEPYYNIDSPVYTDAPWMSTRTDKLKLIDSIQSDIDFLCDCIDDNCLYFYDIKSSDLMAIVYDEAIKERNYLW